MHTWILIMVIFTGPQSLISHMEALSTYPNAITCGKAIKHALSIKMPLERQFTCLRIRRIANSSVSCKTTGNPQGETCAPDKNI